MPAIASPMVAMNVAIAHITALLSLFEPEPSACSHRPVHNAQAGQESGPPTTQPRSRAMLAAQDSMACQSRKSPSGARTAFAIIRSAKDSLLWLRAPKKIRCSRGPIASRNSAISLGCCSASWTSVPSGPLLNSHTGRSAKTAQCEEVLVLAPLTTSSPFRIGRIRSR